jgi:hypothetical protein
MTLDTDLLGRSRDVRVKRSGVERLTLAIVHLHFVADQSAQEVL